MNGAWPLGRIEKTLCVCLIEKLATVPTKWSTHTHTCTHTKSSPEGKKAKARLQLSQPWPTRPNKQFTHTDADAHTTVESSYHLNFWMSGRVKDHLFFCRPPAIPLCVSVCMHVLSRSDLAKSFIVDTLQQQHNCRADKGQAFLVQGRAEVLNFQF